MGEEIKAPQLAKLISRALSRKTRLLVGELWMTGGGMGIDQGGQSALVIVVVVAVALGTQY